MTGLRERKKADTRRALSDATLELALERGLENVTREDIADLAGVSPRTFSNYFSTKYEALAYRQTERLRRSVALLRDHPDTEPLWTSITERYLRPSKTISPLQAVTGRVRRHVRLLPSFAKYWRTATFVARCPVPYLTTSSR